MIKNKVSFTLDECKMAASKYKSRTEFIVQSGQVYNFATKQGWLDECCYHMSIKKKTNGYWNKERCLLEAKKFETRTEFYTKSGSAYSPAKRKRWLDDICKHMKIVGNKKKRKIYVFEFEDNFVYVGLSYNPDDRKIAHLENQSSAVYKHLNKTSSAYQFKILTDGCGRGC